MKDFKEGIKILVSKTFWKDFMWYWSSEQIAERMKGFAKNLRDNYGKRN